MEDANPNCRDFECNICLDMAREPVVTVCGHLFCWPCLYQWLYLHSDTRECPVCKGEVKETNIIPIYGRGSERQHDLVDMQVSEEVEAHTVIRGGVRIPKRPQAQRREREVSETDGGVLGRIRTLRAVLENGYRNHSNRQGTRFSSDQSNGSRRVRQRLMGRRALFESQSRSNGEPHIGASVGLALGLGFDGGESSTHLLYRSRSPPAAEEAEDNDISSIQSPVSRARALLRRHWSSSSPSEAQFRNRSMLPFVPDDLEERPFLRSESQNQNQSHREAEPLMGAEDPGLSVLGSRPFAQSLGGFEAGSRSTVGGASSGEPESIFRSWDSTARDFGEISGNLFSQDPVLGRDNDEIARHLLLARENDEIARHLLLLRRGSSSVNGFTEQVEGVAEEEGEFLRRLPFFQNTRSDESSSARRHLGYVTPILVDEVEERMALRLENTLAREQEEILRYLAVIRRIRDRRLAAFRARLASMSGPNETSVLAQRRDEGSSNSQTIEIISSFDNTFGQEAGSEDGRRSDTIHP